jgi:hypothetical protein
MTVVLVALCVIVGALELYAGRRNKQQADAFLYRIDELRNEVSSHSRALSAVGDQVNTELGRVRRDVLPGLDSRLRQNTGQIEQLSALLNQADQYLRAQANRIQDLEKQKEILAALRARLGDLETTLQTPQQVPSTEEVEGKVDTALTRIQDLERGGDQILALQRDLTRTLEDVEDVVSDLLQFTSEELDQAVASSLNGRPAPGVTVAGRLYARDARLRDVLQDVYERCVAANRLSVRFKRHDGADGRLRYFLAGRSLEELAGGFAALLISTGMDVAHPGHRMPPPDEAALQALLRAVHESTGATAQIGPLIVIRTPAELVCAVLTHAQAMEFESDRLPWDPGAAAVRLRRLPNHQFWDLTEWAAQVPDPGSA